MKISEKLKKNYDSYYSEGSEEQWRTIGAVDKANNILDLCSQIEPSSVIDVGSGEGSVLEVLAKNHFGSEYTAIDISESGIQEIKRKGLNNLSDARVFDGMEIPYGDKTFDLAILSHVVEHLEFPRQLLYEAKRVARFTFIEVPLEDNFRLRKDFVFSRTGHINFYSPKTIRRLVQTCGFEILKQKTSITSMRGYAFAGGKKGILNYWIKRLFLSTSPYLSTKVFTYHNSILAK